MVPNKTFCRVPIGEVFDFPETNSKITKKFCNAHKGPIPVYASSKSETSTLGSIQESIHGVKYYEDCLSWNRNGSVGYVFFRDHKFATNEDHRAMIVKPQYKAFLNRLYLKFEVERQLLLNGFSYLDKCGVGKIKEVDIFIPIDPSGIFDEAEQARLANQYIRVEQIKDELATVFNKIDEVNISMSYRGPVAPFSLDELFYIKKGSSKYTQKYLHNNRGPYPVYSSQTLRQGEFGKIDTYDFEEECFTWTTDGVYAGTVFYRNGRFSVTTHCGVLLVRPKYEGLIDFRYLRFKLNELLQSSTLGEGANRRVGVERMKELSVDLPVDLYGKPNLLQQQEIAERYEKVYEVKARLQVNYQHLIDSKVGVIDEALISISDANLGHDLSI